MNQPAITPADRLEIQLKKWLNRGSLHNVVLHPNYSRSGLPVCEKIIADVTDKGGRCIAFAETGFIAPGHGFVRYDQVVQVNWVSSNNHKFGPAEKHGVFDRLEFDLVDGVKISLKDLDQAVFPLLKFFEWITAVNHK